MPRAWLIKANVQFSSRWRFETEPNGEDFYRTLYLILLWALWLVQFPTLYMYAHDEYGTIVDAIASLGVSFKIVTKCPGRGGGLPSKKVGDARRR